MNKRLAGLGLAGVLACSGCEGMYSEPGSEMRILGLLAGVNAPYQDDPRDAAALAAAGRMLSNYGAAQSGRSNVNVTIVNPGQDNFRRREIAPERNPNNKYLFRSEGIYDIQFVHFVDGDGDGRYSPNENNGDYVNIDDGGDYFSNSLWNIGVDQGTYGGKKVKLEVRIGNNIRIFETRVPPLREGVVEGTFFILDWDSIKDMKKREEAAGLRTDRPTECGLLLYVEDGEYPSSARKMTIYWNTPFPRR